MKDSCSKCGHEDVLECYIINDKNHCICKMCLICIESPVTLEKIKDFLTNDELPISEVSRNMIGARKNRANGVSPWMDIVSTSYDANGNEIIIPEGHSIV